MSELEKRLSGFQRRVRWMRAWKGLAIGGTLGAVVSLVLSTLDYFRVAYSSWLWLGVPVLAGLLIGAVVGFFMKLRVNDLADSIDRRAALENRLGTAAEGVRDEMGNLQRTDALAHLQGLKPAAVYPVRVTRWHGGMLAMSVLAASVFLLGNAPFMLDEKEKAEREEMKQLAAEIEKVVKPILEKPAELSPETKEIAKEFEELKRELERGRMPKEEAMQKANKLAEKAEKNAVEKFQQSEQQMATAQQQLEKMAEKDALKELGLTEEDFKEGEIEKASQMSEEERQEMAKEMSEQLNSMKSQLGMQSKSQQGKEANSQESQNSQSEQKSLEEQMKSMEQELADIQKQLESGKDAKGNQLSKEQMEKLQELSKQMQELMKQLKMSEKIQEFMKKLQAMKEYEEIQKLMQQLAEKMQKSQQGQQDPGETPEMTEKEMAELKKKMEEAMKKLEEAISKMSDADMKEMLEGMKKALEDAIKNGCEACQGAGMCMGLMPGLGMMPGMGMPMGMPTWGPSGPGQDNTFRNIDAIPLNKDPQDIKAGAMPIGTKGQRQDRGDERYVEIRGPVKPGEKSSTPYFKVLPKYKKQAEDALDKDRIPKEHQKRVKEYFDSLSKGGK